MEANISHTIHSQIHMDLHSGTRPMNYFIHKAVNVVHGRDTHDISVTSHFHDANLSIL